MSFLYVFLISLTLYLAAGQENATLGCGDMVSGFVGSDEMDSYVLTLSTSEYVSISACGSGFDTILTLYDSLNNEIEVNDDSDECGLASILKPGQLSTGDYTIEIEGFNEISFGGYDLEVFCNSNTDPTIPIVEGVEVASDCNFIDFANGFIIPMDVCVSSTVYSCDSDGNVQIAEYTDFDFDCASDSVEAEDFVSYQKYEYNCGGSAEGCDLARFKLNCTVVDVEASYVRDQCSSNNAMAICDGTSSEDGSLQLIYYENDDCTVEDYVINVGDLSFAPDELGECSISWECIQGGGDSGEDDGGDSVNPQYIAYNIMVVIFICISMML